MSVKIIKKSQHVTNSWPGGTTTQLFIYPKHANYQKRDFLFRLSTATVEIDRSDFTSLPGFKRKLMILDGELTIHHKDRYSKELKKFVQDEFDGGWETSAEGKCVDFNLMMAGAVTGSIEHMILGKGQKSPIELGLFSFIYLYKGSLSLDDDNASEGDLVVIEDPKEIILLANERCEMVICSVNGQLKGPAF